MDRELGLLGGWKRGLCIRPVPRIEDVGFDRSLLRHARFVLHWLVAVVQVSGRDSGVRRRNVLKVSSNRKIDMPVFEDWGV